VPVLTARGIVKRFPGVVANDGVDLDVTRGEVHTILGENGAGKSTLAAVLCGLYRPDEGEVRIDGERVTLHSPRDGLARGIGMVHQHFRLVDRFTVAENVALGDESQPVVLDTSRLEREVAGLGERFGLPIRPRARVSDLSVGERQRVEIVKTLYRGAEVLLLDEPTAVLTPHEVDALFSTVRAMCAAGKAVVFISHKLGEVMEVSDRITVMRDGRVTGDVRAADTDRREQTDEQAMAKALETFETRLGKELLAPMIEEMARESGQTAGPSSEASSLGTDGPWSGSPAEPRGVRGPWG